MRRLDDLAQVYIRRAAEAERRGKREESLFYYRKAAEVIEKLLSLYPDSPLNKAYLENLRIIKKKLKMLEAEMDAEPIGAGEETPPWILKQKPNVTFNDIVDLEHAKRAIKEAIVYPVMRPDLFLFGWPRGILLYGPPGCGKTMLAAAVANEVKAEFLYVDSATIMSKWLGEAEKNVAKLFAYARELADSGKPVIIFIDEVDSLLGVHGSEVGGEVRARNQFLKEMDGIQDKNSKRHVYVLAATNKPWKLDEAFIRRFEKRIYIPPPTFTARKRLFMSLISKVKHEDIDFDKLAEMTEGYSFADITAIVKDAYNKIVVQYMERGGNGTLRALRMEDLMDAISNRKPSISEEMIKAYEEWNSKFGT